MAEARKTYTVKTPLMKGPGVREWQKLIKAKFKKLGINCPIATDGVYGQQTRSYGLELLKAMGMSRAGMHKHGVTPALRDKVRDSRRTANEKKSFNSRANKAYRAQLKKRWVPRRVSKPVRDILTDSWGFHPGVHDGVDVITRPNAPLMAMVKSKVIDVRGGGWWGKAPSGDVRKGDGIVQLRVLENVGPFKKGQHIGYGHCEHARVRVGEVVQAGEVIALAGLANAWHIHLMVNGGGTTKGVGTINPRPHLEYVKKHG